MSFRLSPEAEADLAAISDYIAVDDPNAARRMLGWLEERFVMLSEFPAMGVARDEIRSGLRLLPVGNYLVLYRQAADGVEVVRVIHGARQWQDLL